MMADNFRVNDYHDEQMRAMDPYVHAHTMISEPHRMVHDGFMLNASGKASALANGANLDLLIRLPAGVIRHVVLVEFAPSDAPLDVFLYEDTTVSADGTAVNIRNHNRTAADPTVDLMFVGPTVTGVGTLLHQQYIPSTGALGGQSAGQIVGSDDQEWILGSPTTEKLYMWRVTNNSGGAIDIGYHFNGYRVGYTE